METTPCRICREPTPMFATELCNRCWELITRIEASPAIAARVMRDLGFTVTRADICPPKPAPKKRSTKKATRPAGWSEAAWERYLAAQRATSYSALDASNLSAAVMRKLDRTEEIRPPVNFRARFSYASTQQRKEGKKLVPGPANAALVDLVKLGAPSDAIHVETEEEAQRRELLDEYRSAKISARVTLPEERHYSGVDPYLSHFFQARNVAAKLLAVGLREEARDLLSTVRGNERAVFARFGTLEPSFGADRLGVTYSRAGHRKQRAAQRARTAEASGE